MTKIKLEADVHEHIHKMENVIAANECKISDCVNVNKRVHIA